MGILYNMIWNISSNILNLTQLFSQVSRYFLIIFILKVDFWILIFFWMAAKIFRERLIHFVWNFQEMFLLIFVVQPV